MTSLARLKKEPYKTFIEELLPFSIYCTWKYDNRTDVECYLAKGTGGRDGIIKDLNTGEEHSIEITWPIDGRAAILEAKQLNETGVTKVKVRDLMDTSENIDAMNRIFSTAEKKQLRDYTCIGGSTLIFVVDKWPLFWDDNPEHMKLFDSMIEQLQGIEFKADNILIMKMPKGDIVSVKSTEIK